MAQNTGKKKYVFSGYAESRNAKGELKVHKAGEVISLTAAEAKEYAGAIEPVKKAEAAGDADDSNADGGDSTDDETGDQQ